MGNCPSGFQLIPNGVGCVVQCPSERNFEFTMQEGAPVCAYKHDKTKFVRLNPIASLSEQGIQTITPQQRGQFNAELARFNQELPVVVGQIEKTKLAEDAFRDLQAAENVRDQSPAAYQAARAKYYTLVKGESWQQEERKRIMRADVQPIVQQYQDRYQNIRQQITDQQKTIDVVKSVKDKVLSVQDELQYSVSMFGKQLASLKNQINMKNRKEETGMFDWLNLILNVVLVAFLVAAIYAIYRKMNKSVYSYTTPYY